MSETKLRVLWATLPKSFAWTDTQLLEVAHSESKKYCYPLVEKSALDQAQARIAELEAQLEESENGELKWAVRSAELEAENAEAAKLLKESGELMLIHGVNKIVKEKQERIRELEAKCADYERALKEVSLSKGDGCWEYDCMHVFDVADKALDKWREKSEGKRSQFKVIGHKKVFVCCGNKSEHRGDCGDLSDQMIDSPIYDMSTLKE